MGKNNDIRGVVSTKTKRSKSEGTQRRIRRCNQRIIAIHFKLATCAIAAILAKNYISDTLLPKTAVSAFVAPASRYKNGLFELRGANEDRKSILMATSNTNKQKGGGSKKSQGQRGGKSKADAFAINKQLTSSKSAPEVLELFISKGGAKGVAGGDAFNSVNFSTCLHRLAKYSTYVDYSARARGEKVSPEAQRRKVLSDPRVAILIAALSEAIINPKNNRLLTFQNRDLSNIAWAIAKMKLAPPADVFPMKRTGKITESNPSIVQLTEKDLEVEMLEMAKKVRTQVLEVAKERSAVVDPKQRLKVKNRWIPTLSQLCAIMLDKIALRSIDSPSGFKSQETSNLLYAFASVGRADDVVFDAFTKKLAGSINSSSDFPKPQEFR